MKSNAKTAIITLVLFLLVSWAHAHEQDARIHGKDIELRLVDHGIAGSVRGRLLLATRKAGPSFESVLLFREGMEILQSSFKKEGTAIGGRIESKLKSGELKVTTAELVSVDPNAHTITMKFNDETVVVSIRAEDQIAGHYINPTYTLRYNDEPIEFKIEGGEACMGCSVHLLFQIVGAYIH